MEKKYELALPVVLSQDKAIAMGQRLADAAFEAAEVEGRIEGVRQEAKLMIKDLKEELSEHRSKIKKLARAIRNMEDIVPVMVEARVADNNSKVEVVRMDTGEVVQERPLTEEDRQMQLEDVLDKVEADTKAAIDDPIDEEPTETEDPELPEEEKDDADEPEDTE